MTVQTERLVLRVSRVFWTNVLGQNGERSPRGHCVHTEQCLGCDRAWLRISTMCVECVSGCVGVVRTCIQDNCKREGKWGGWRPLGSKEGVFVTLTHTHSPLRPFTPPPTHTHVGPRMHPNPTHWQINYAAGCRDGDDRSGKSCNISDPIVHITVETW
jgi:hypothetical protein